MQLRFEPVDVVFLVTEDFVSAVPAALVGGLGIPNWVLSFLKKRRIKKFVIEFPNAIDVIIRGVKAGQIAATSQQYPLKMASLGVAAVVKYAKTGAKPHGYTDTGVTLITNKPASGLASKDVTFGLANCWG